MQAARSHFIGADLRRRPRLFAMQRPALGARLVHVQGPRRAALGRAREGGQQDKSVLLPA